MGRNARLVTKQAAQVSLGLHDELVCGVCFTMVIEHPLNPLPVLEEVFLQQRQHLIAEDRGQSLQGWLVEQRHEVRVTEAMIAVQKHLDALVHHRQQPLHVDTLHGHLAQQLGTRQHFPEVEATP
ncbi:hypothetical protein D3C79_801440 [compost metagenome]